MAAVRQQITIAASMRTVWNAITTEEGIRKWWAREARVDARKGGRIVLIHEGEEGDVQERGVFHAVRPTRHVDIKFDSVGTSPLKGTALNFQLGRDGEEVKLHIVQSGGESLDDEEVHAEVDAAWQVRLRKLREVLEA
jgi:uncharacterized protein YndB with AHSA1/START domain